MNCKFCGKENPDGTKICGHCGIQLEGKIQCKNCEKLINNDSSYCPHCGTVLSKDSYFKEKTVSGKTALNTKDILISSITNSVGLFFSILLMILLFCNFARLDIPRALSDDINQPLPLNSIDFVDSIIARFSNYGMNDFMDEYGELEIHEISRINFLKIYMIKEFDNSVIVQRIAIYINILLILALLILPLILLILSIINLVHFKYTKTYKKFFFVILLLGLILSKTITLIGYRVTFPGILYIVIASLGLIYSFVVQIINKERNFDSKQFILKLITSLSLLLLVILVTNGLGRIRSENGLGFNIKLKDFLFILNSFNPGLQFDELISSTILPTGVIPQSLKIIAIVISVLVLIILGLLLSSLMIETKNNIEIKTKNIRLTTIFVWLSFSIEVAVIIMVIIFNIIYNNYLSTNKLGYISAHLGFTIIFTTLLTLALAIYLSIVPEYQIFVTRLIKTH